MNEKPRFRHGLMWILSMRLGLCLHVLALLSSALASCSGLRSDAWWPGGHLQLQIYLLTSQRPHRKESASVWMAPVKALEMSHILGVGQVSIPKTISEGRGRKSRDRRGLSHGGPWGQGEVPFEWTGTGKRWFPERKWSALAGGRRTDGGPAGRKHRRPSRHRE